MLRRVQRGYACFDAYARISLAVSAQQLVLVESYFALGHFMSKSEGGRGWTSVESGRETAIKTHGNRWKLMKTWRKWKDIEGFSTISGWPSLVQNTEGAWLALLSGVYACWILWKLDLYMKRNQRRSHQRITLLKRYIQVLSSRDEPTYAYYTLYRSVLLCPIYIYTSIYKVL